jgi:hypothetical protein
MFQPRPEDACLAHLRAHTPHTLGHDMLANDPVAADLPAEARRSLVSAALDDGTAVGAMLNLQYPGRGPEAVATALGVRIVETHDDPFAGPFWRHADYRARPPEIRLFATALAALDGLMANPEIACLVGVRRSAPVFVAHELYHHVEATRAEPRLARRHAVARLRIGAIRLAAPVLALSEIAAGACAQAMLGLPHHAAILDLLALSHVPLRATGGAALRRSLSRTSQ